MRIKRATLVVLLSALALRATCTEEKAGWTCESDGFWHENGVKSEYGCSQSDSKADDGDSKEDSDKSDSTSSMGDSEKEDEATVCPGDGTDAGFNADEFVTTRRTCIKGPPNDAMRCWWTYTPRGSSEVPLVIDMHGGGGCASHRARWSGFKALADANKFAVAWPAGYSNQWGTCGSDCEAVKAASGGKSIHDIDDITFIAQLIAFEAARTVGTIDRTRVYLTGFSMGCMMAHRFAMERSDLVAGFGCHGGDLIGAGADLNAQQSRYSIKHTPAFMTGGSADAWFAPAAFVTWRLWNGCDMSAGNSSVTSTNVTSPRVGNVRRGVNCDAPTARYVIDDGIHAEDAAMAAATWDFIGAFERPGAASAIAEVPVPESQNPSAGSRVPVGIAVLATAAIFSFV